MLNEIKIINLNNADKAQWYKLWQDYLKFYQCSVAEEVTEHTWNRLSSNEYENIYGYAACNEGRIVGIVHVIEHASCWTLKPYAYLQDLFTHEAYRGQGIARQLIEHVNIQTKQRQCDRVYWLTHQDNLIAQNLYDKVAKKTGFIQYKL